MGKFGGDYDIAFVDLGVKAGIREELAKTLLRIGVNKENVEADIKEAFRRWDTDDSGKIGKDEFLALMRKLSAQFTDEEVEQLFHAADANSDDRVDYDEFVAWLFKGDL